jgi:hypothetical protein
LLEAAASKATAGRLAASMTAQRGTLTPRKSKKSVADGGHIAVIGHVTADELCVRLTDNDRATMIGDVQDYPAIAGDPARIPRSSTTWLRWLRESVHGDADPREHRRTSEVEPHAHQAFSERLTLEVNGGKDEVVRDLDTQYPVGGRVWVGGRRGSSGGREQSVVLVGVAP